MTAAAPQVEPASIGKPGFVQQIETTRESIKAWPQWMQDASVETGATMPTQQAEPKVAASFYTEDAELIGTTGAPIKKVEVEDDGSIHVFIDHWPQPEQPIDLDAVAMQQMRQAAAESTWMPSEYTSNDWIADVCGWLRNGPPAAAPQAEPKREPLSDDAISYEHACRSSYESACAASDFDSFKLGVRFAESAHGIGGSDE